MGQTAPRKVELDEGLNNTGQGSLLWVQSSEKASLGGLIQAEVSLKRENV